GIYHHLPAVCSLPCMWDTYDFVTEEAVRAYQKFFRLQIDGQVNSETLRMISAPRCGVPDSKVTDPSSRYNLNGSKWWFLNPSWATDFTVPVFPANADDRFGNAIFAWSFFSGIRPRKYLGDFPTSATIYAKSGPTVHQGKYHLCPGIFDSNVYAHAYR